MGILVTKKTIANLRANVFTVHDPMFPLYVIRGKQNLMIDCSILAKAREIEKNLLAFLGNEKIDRVLLTHSHYDHTGACSYLQEKFGFAIMASYRTKEILENDKAIGFIDDLNQKFKKILHDSSDLVFSKPERVQGIGENEDIKLADGQTIAIIETPGHTRCSISFLLKPENILFPGDAAGVIEKSGKIKPLFLSSYTQYERSLRKLIAIQADVLALPHNTAVKGKKQVSDFLESSLWETLKLKEEIMTALHDKPDFGQIAENILAREYSFPTIMGPREALLINVTAMVKSVYYEFVKVP
jgi:glyoxylase-like metal-dependent hydrolase (beta-lactamase superfamily II)